MHGGLHRPRLQTAAHRAARLVTLDQVGARQHVEMLHDRRQRDRERCGKLAHRQLRLSRQPVDDRPPRRIGERGEGQIELGVAKLNHVVKYCKASVRMSTGRGSRSCVCAESRQHRGCSPCPSARQWPEQLVLRRDSLRRARCTWAGARSWHRPFKRNAAGSCAIPGERAGASDAHLLPSCYRKGPLVVQGRNARRRTNFARCPGYRRPDGHVDAMPGPDRSRQHCGAYDLCANGALLLTPTALPRSPAACVG
jgi:hypothetical protein